MEISNTKTSINRYFSAEYFAELVNDRRRVLFFSVAIALFALLTCIYLPSFDNPFAFDDQHAIVDNLTITSLKNYKAFFTDISAISVLPTNQVYRPLAVLSIALDYYIGGGLNPVAFHRSMYIVFILQLIALYYLVRVILVKGGYESNESKISLSALLITALYGFNTTLAETLNYVVSRSDSYSTFFAVLSMAMYTANGYSRKKYLYLIPIFLGTLTKETGVTVFLLIFCYEFLFSLEDRFWLRFKKAFVATIPSLVTTILFLVLYLKMSVDPPHAHVSRILYLATQVYVTAHYFLMFLLPVHLCADADVRLFKEVFDERTLLSLFIHALFLWGIILGLFQRKYAPVAFGFLWFYIALAPTSSLLPIDDAQNDHRMFYPLVGTAIALGTLCFIAFNKFERVAGRTISNFVLSLLFVIYIAGHSYGLTVRNEIWGSKELLWKDVTIKSPENARGLMNYGISLMARGEYKGAREYYVKALKFWPTYSYLHINLGVLNGAENNIVEAEREFKLAIELNPTNPTGLVFYANWLKGQQRYKESLDVVSRALTLSPGYMAAINLQNSLLTIQTQTTPVTARSYTPPELQGLKSAYDSGQYEKVINESLKFFDNQALKNQALEFNARSLIQLKRYDEAEIIIRSLLTDLPYLADDLKNIEKARRAGP